MYSCRIEIMSKPKGYRGIEVLADEGEYMPGGEGSAPTPLTYFVSGVALCLLSHLTELAAKKRLQITNPRVKVLALFHEQGSALKGNKEGSCDGVDVSIQIDSDESREKILDLMKMSQKACFAIDALTRSNPPVFQNTLNGEAV
jgi:uncharacterized OsmC-like protein